MICRGCGYELTGLGAGACPECGRGFDPADPATFATGEDWMRSQQRWRILAWIAPIAAAWPFVLYCWMLAMLVVARLQLGRWPGRSGMDDPKQIPIVAGMHTIAMFGMMATPILVVAGFALIWRVYWRNSRVGLGLFFGVAALYGAVVFVHDPARLMEWVMD